MKRSRLGAAPFALGFVLAAAVTLKIIGIL